MAQINSSPKQPASSVSARLCENIAYLDRTLPIGESFDFLTRDLHLGDTKAYWIGLNGFTDCTPLQKIFSDLQDPGFTENTTVDDIVRYMNSKIGYVEITLASDWSKIIDGLLSGTSLLLVDGFDQAMVLDTRTYPTRSISEPDEETITRGARDGFVETMLVNANLIRRRIRSSNLVFQHHFVGEESKTDVCVTYIKDKINPSLLKALEEKIASLRVSSLTMGATSLSELLVPRSWFHPLPSIQYTERPDVACSYLSEGHILIIVDNSPLVLILPCTIFQFTQSPEDYYKAPLTGTYFRLVRFACIPVCLFLMPLFMLITAYFPDISERWNLITTGDLSPVRLIFYVLAVEFFLDLFKYSASLTSGRFSGSLSIVGGLLIGDIAVSLNWASSEVLFYGALSLLTSLSISSIELSEALRIYRMFLLIVTALGGVWGFAAGTALIFLSVLTTPTFGKLSYFWPLFPFNGKALRTLLFRYPTVQAQPDKNWDRGPVRPPFEN